MLATYKVLDVIFSREFDPNSKWGEEFGMLCDFSYGERGNFPLLESSVLMFWMNIVEV